jgi:hypothetical protein
VAKMDWAWFASVVAEQGDTACSRSMKHLITATFGKFDFFLLERQPVATFRRFINQWEATYSGVLGTHGCSVATFDDVSVGKLLENFKLLYSIIIDKSTHILGSRGMARVTEPFHFDIEFVCCGPTFRSSAQMSTISKQ